MLLSENALCLLSVDHIALKLDRGRVKLENKGSEQGFHRKALSPQPAASYQEPSEPPARPGPPPWRRHGEREVAGVAMSEVPQRKKEEEREKKHYLV